MGRAPEAKRADRHIRCASRYPQKGVRLAAWAGPIPGRLGRLRRDLPILRGRPYKRARSCRPCRGRPTCRGGMWLSRTETGCRPLLRDDRLDLSPFLSERLAAIEAIAGDTNRG